MPEPTESLSVTGSAPELEQVRNHVPMSDFKFCILSQDGVSLITELINSEMKNISEFGDGKGKITNIC